MEEQVSFNPTQQVRGKKNKTPMIVGIVLIVVFLVIGIFMLRKSKKTDDIKDTVIKKEEVSPTEKVKIDKSAVKIQVLNGTGTEGQAGLVVTALKEAGFTADNLKTDNAEDFDHSVTTIVVKETISDLVDSLKDTLKSIFDEIEIETAYLDSDNEFDAIITTGGKKAEEEVTPTVSPTDDSEPTITSTPSPSTTPAPTETPTP